MKTWTQSTQQSYCKRKWLSYALKVILLSFWIKGSSELDMNLKFPIHRVSDEMGKVHFHL